MKPRVYLETTVISYLVGRPSRDLIVAARQQITQDWWRFEKPKFEVHVSEVVVQEAENGDESAIRQRLEAIKGISLLPYSPDVSVLAQALINQQAIPATAATDAVHVALAAMNGMDFVLTWNFKHIANAVTRSRVERIIRSAGLEPPVLCTPEELSETD